MPAFFVVDKGHRGIEDRWDCLPLWNIGILVSGIEAMRVLVAANTLVRSSELVFRMPWVALLVDMQVSVGRRRHREYMQLPDEAVRRHSCGDLRGRWGHADLVMPFSYMYRKRGRSRL